MKTYLYHGPDSGITLQDHKTSTDVLLRHGVAVELPEDNEAVKTLVAQGYLVEQTAPAPAPAPAPAKKATAKE
jgi:hypothetical protein